MPFALLLVVTLAFPADGMRIEVSDDGHETVTITDTAPPALPAGPSAVPYNAAPDWANDLRRQVGGLQVADMNGDGLNDVVVGCYISNSFPPYDAWNNLIYFNVGGALEATPSWVSTDAVSTGDVRVGDINGDGFPDIFSANGGGLSNPSVIYFGSATGPSSAPGWSSAEPGGAWNNNAALFDVDHDGDLDVVTANQGSGQFDPYRKMHLFENNAGVLDTVPSWSSAEESIQGFLAFGDLDGDGWEDLAVSKWINFESAIYRNNAGTLATTPTWTTAEDGDDKGVAWADVDDDGDVDLALGHDPTQLWTNVGGTPVLGWSSGASFFGHSDILFADVDGDGDPDLAEVHFSDGKVHIYLNTDGVLATTPSWTYDSSAVGTAIAFGDLTGNGRLDLVVGNSGDDSVLVFFNTLGPVCATDIDGSGATDLGDLLAVLSNWGACPGCPADLDGNDDVGLSDLLAVLSAWGACP